MQSRRRTGRRSRRRGRAIVLPLALAPAAVVGLAAAATDTIALYAAKADLQRAAGKAALAAAATLSSSEFLDLAPQNVSTDRRTALSEAILGSAPGLSDAAFVLGSARYDDQSGRFAFVPAGNATIACDAIRVTVQRGEHPPGAVRLALSGVLGVAPRELSATATAMLRPRDIALVIDLSNSMGWDSQLRSCDRVDGGYVNTRDIWCALNGSEPSRPYLPGSDSQSEYAPERGPTIGAMTNWGNPLRNGYSAADDPGLWHLRRGMSNGSAAIAASLNTRGYSAAERSALLSGALDADAKHWRRRAATTLGLAEWKSGKPCGVPGGNGDDKLDPSEVAYIAYPGWRGDWSWTQYIDWVQSSSVYCNTAIGGASEFRYRYGLKTFVDFLLESQPDHDSTGNLWHTPQQPLRAVKDGVQAFADVLSGESTRRNSLRAASSSPRESLLTPQHPDRISLEVFASSARHEVDLTDSFQLVAERLYQLQSGHYDRMTNIGGGLQRAIEELCGERARAEADRLIVLLSDGVPNVNAANAYVGEGSAEALRSTFDMAELARQRGITIHCIGVGSGVDRSVMQEIARIGNGTEHHAAGNPAEYHRALENIFRTLGKTRAVARID